MAYNTTNVISSFESFYQGWLVHQEHYLDELLSAQNSQQQCDGVIREEELKDLVSRVLYHYQHYFEEKTKVGIADVFVLFSPSWLSPLERSLLWMAGFKPGMLIRLAENSVNDLSDDQKQRLDSMRRETKMLEKQLWDELARVQESVAAPPIFEVIRRGGRGVVNGVWRDAEQVLQTVTSEMQSLVGNADLLRLATARGLVDLLKPLQSVRVLAALAQLQLRVRAWGWEREAERRRQDPQNYF